MSSPSPPPPPPPSSKQPGPNFVGMNSVLKSLLENPLSLKPGADSGKDKEKGIEDEATGSNMMASAFLGPTLWDKTLPYMDNFQLEYMDLDEFLSENGIPPAPGGSSAATPAALVPQQQQQQQQQAATTQSSLPPPSSSSSSSSIPQPLPSTIPPSATQPGTVTMLLPVGGGGGEGGGGGGGGGLPSANATVVAPAGMHTEISGSRINGVRPVSVQLEPPVRSPSVVDLSSRTAPPPPPPQAAARGEPRNTPSPIDPESIEVSIGYDPDPVDLALSSVPGQEMFDPRRRKFSEEELKPQPIVKKAKKNLIPVDLRDDRYWARRRKNNVAAKRSRDARRLKENQIAVRAAFLEKENSVLRQEMAELKRDLGRYRNIVGKYEAKHGSL